MNNYGGISKVPVERLVIVLEGTADEDPRHPKSIWLEYDFHCNPGGYYSFWWKSLPRYIFERTIVSQETCQNSLAQ